MDKETYQQIWKEASMARGAIINQTALLEKHLDEIIARYFCGMTNKRNELINCVLATDKITLDSKRKILRYVINKNYPQFNNDNKKWFNDFQKILENRNTLAHCAVDM